MTQFVPIGVGAGLVSALLSAVVMQGTALALLLYLLAPVPILVAALGWDHRAGLVGAVVGAVALAVSLSPVSGLGFALGSALPAWWLAYLTMLGRQAPDGTMEWYPLGRLLVWVAGISALTYLIAAAVPEFDYSVYEERVREATDTILRIQTGTPEGVPLPATGEVTGAELTAMLARIVPIFAAQGFTLLLVLYLWLGAKIVSISGRLARPWPSIPQTAMPQTAVLALLGSAAVAALVGGFVGLFALAFSGALAMAFGLQGLAAIHHVTMGRNGRTLILIGTYLLIFFSQGLVLAALVLGGIADTVFGLRARHFASRPPTIKRNPPKE